MAWSDDELIAECIRENGRAWDEFVDRFGKLVYGTARTVLGRYGLRWRDDLADEIHQQVFVEFWEKKRLVHLRETRSLRPFLAAVTVSRSVDTLRTVLKTIKRGLPEPENGSSRLDGLESPTKDPASASTGEEAMGIIEAEIEGLPAKEGHILKLSVLEGLTHQEIAELMGIPQNTVSTVIRRARQKVKEALQKKGLEL